MKQRSLRLTKKLHKNLLPEILYEVSTSPYWRKLLFASKPNEIFNISYSSSNKLSSPIEAALAKYSLEYQVALADGSEAEYWLSENGNIVFKFWPKEIPTLKTFSGNNPNCMG